MIHKSAQKYNLSQKVVDEIYNETKSILEGLGYELVDIEYSEMYKSLQVFVLIWKKEKIQFEDCEKVHPLISEMLDKFDGDFPEKYTLNISSVGLDRPIVTDDDFRRNLDEEIIDSIVKKYGVLVKYDDENVVLKNAKNEEFVIKRKGNKFEPYIRF